MNQIERRVVDAIDTEAMLRFLGELVGIRSLDGHESEAQRFMARSMRSFGMAVDEWEIDLAALRQHPAFCWEVMPTWTLATCVSSSRFSTSG